MMLRLLAVAFAAASPAPAAPEPPATCQEVIEQVGNLPLWMAEQIAKVKYPWLTAEQIEWGKKCLLNQRENKRGRSIHPVQ